MKNAELVMALAGTALQVGLCLILVVRGSYRQFRYFSLLTIFSVLSTITLLAVQNNFVWYLRAYWITEAFAVALTFVALQESFYLVFRTFQSIPWFKLLFPGIGLLMLLVAILRALSHPVSQAIRLASALISLEIAVGFLQFGLFCLFILLVRFFHMRWRQHAFGVVLGFGVESAGSLVAFLLRSEFGTKLDPVVRIAPPIAYIIAVLVWLATFLRAEPAQQVPEGLQALTPEHVVSELRRYTRAVKGILER
jgi:hypothetical protein